jgi:hypothetical protein
MRKQRKYSMTLKDGRPLLIEADGFNSRKLPGWIVFTRNGRDWQAVAAQAIHEGPEEVDLECNSIALAAVLTDMQLKEQDSPQS